MVGCKGCGESLQAEAQAKQDRGEELTQDEQAVLDADDPNDVAPRVFRIPAYGRLSPYDGSICGFCERVGFGLAIVLTIILSTVLPEEIVLGSMTVTPEFALGVAFLVQVAMVLVYGRYLLVGPIFGPIVERFAASAGLYLTEKSKQEHGGSNGDSPVDYDHLPEDAVVEGEGESIGVALPGNPTERERQLAEQLEQQKKITKQGSRKSRLSFAESLIFLKMG